MRNSTVEHAIAELPVDVRKAAENAIAACNRRGYLQKQIALTATKRLIVAVRRADQRRASDQVTDYNRRVLVGARVPRADYARYKEAAEKAGVSLYRWVCDALEAAL